MVALWRSETGGQAVSLVYPRRPLAVLGAALWLVSGTARAQESAAAGAATPEAASAATVTPAMAETAVETAADSTTTTADTADEVLPFKLSLPTQEDASAWRDTGFRLELGMAYGLFEGVFGAPSGTLLGPTVRVGTRVDALWSLLASLQYQSITSIGGINGLRYSGTLDPVLHVGDHLQFALGLGFGGIVEAGSRRPDSFPSDFTNLSDSYTYLSAKTPLPSCTGVGIVGLARVAWQQVLGPLSALTAFAEFHGQHTACEQRIGRVDPDTARPFFRRQYWFNVAAQAGLTVGWH